jgi:hypothetical protein
VRRPSLRRLAPSRDLATSLVELFGIGCLATFAYFVWPPAALLVIGLAALVLAWAASNR